MKATRHLAFTFTLLSVAVAALSGCGSNGRGVAQDPLKVEAKDTGLYIPQDFALTEMKFPVAIFFLWKPEATAEQVTKMGDAGSQFGAIKLMVLKRKRAQGLLEEAKAGLDAVGQGLGQIEQGRKQLTDAKAELIANLGALANEISLEKDRLRQDPARDPAILNKLQADYAEGDIKAKELEERDRVLAGKQQTLLAQKQVIEGKIALLEGGIAQITQRLKEELKGQDPDQVMLQLRLGVLELLSDEFSTPQGVEVRPAAGGLPEITIAGWDARDSRGPRVFSTKDGSIREPRYEVYGGKLSFEIVAEDGRIYKFSFARNNYSKIKDGVVSFHGSIVRTNPLNGDKRIGTAKLAGS